MARYGSSTQRPRSTRQRGHHAPLQFENRLRSRRTPTPLIIRSTRRCCWLKLPCYPERYFEGNQLPWWLDRSIAAILRCDKRFARQYCYEPPPGFRLASIYPSIARHLSGSARWTQTPTAHGDGPLGQCCRSPSQVTFTLWLSPRLQGLMPLKLAHQVRSLVRVSRRDTQDPPTHDSLTPWVRPSEHQQHGAQQAVLGTTDASSDTTQCPRRRERSEVVLATPPQGRCFPPATPSLRPKGGCEGQARCVPADLCLGCVQLHIHARTASLHHQRLHLTASTRGTRCLQMLEGSNVEGWPTHAEGPLCFTPNGFRSF